VPGAHICGQPRPVRIEGPERRPTDDVTGRLDATVGRLARWAGRDMRDRADRARRELNGRAAPPLRFPSAVTMT
jgi:hypothetical protein